MTRRFAIIGVAALALTGTAVLQAQPPRPANAGERPRMEQAQRGSGFGQGVRRGGPGMALRGLKLSDDQKAQLRAIHEKTKADVDAVLTPEQRKMLKNRRTGRGGGRR
jgi:Spy/CpxP family protein refolding chaperone